MSKNQPSYVHCGGDKPLIGSTINTFLRTITERFGEREAIVSIPQNKRLTYTQLDDEVRAVARGLVAMGIGRGDRVGVWGINHIEWALVQLATARIGAILVNINPAYRIAELRHALRLAEVNAVFLMPEFKSSKYADMLRELVPEGETCEPLRLKSNLLPHLRRVVVWDPMDIKRTKRWAPGFFTWQEMLDLSTSVPQGTVKKIALALDPDDPINIQFTSGTTGFPKAVVLTHHNILNNAWSVGHEMGFTEADRLCVPLPFYHCFGMVLSNLLCFVHGACLVIPSAHFEPGDTLHAIANEKCTAIHGVPTMFVAELDHPDFGSLDLSSLRTGIMAGAPCPAELMRRVREDMGCKDILIGYGQTECSPIATLTRPEDSVEVRLTTVGKPIPHQECKIVDPEEGHILPLGEPGEVCTRGYHVMREYYAQRDATKDAIDPAGWLHTGDLGKMDASGYVSITGRLKDMIIRGGENIYPAEVEAFYYHHDDIEEIAVFGVADERLGEEVGAWIKLVDGKAGSIDAMRAFAKDQIAHFKVPRLWWFVDEFPMTVTGKIQKNRIRDAVERWKTAGGDDAPSPVERYLR